MGQAREFRFGCLGVQSSDPPMLGQSPDVAPGSCLAQGWIQILLVAFPPTWGPVWDSSSLRAKLIPPSVR